MDLIDRKLLTLIQTSFPIQKRPFKKIGQNLGITEDESLNRIRLLKEKKIIRDISAIFESRTLGYKSTLVAMKVPEEKLQRAAEIVNIHPGVGHNYRRDHEFNLWFTLTVPDNSPLEHTVKKLKELTGALSARLLPTIRLFKIGVTLNMEEDISQIENILDSAEKIKYKNPEKLTLIERKVVKELQKDISLIKEPFNKLAINVGIPLKEFLQIAKSFKYRGIMRRFSAVLYHRNAGFKANAMVVWIVPESRIEEVGNKMASYKAVTHCYERPTYKDWPYSIFSMIHGRNKKECEKVVSAIKKETGITEYAILYSTEEYRKVRVKYFNNEFKKWQREFLN